MGKNRNKDNHNNCSNITKAAMGTKQTMCENKINPTVRMVESLRYFRVVKIVMIDIALILAY